jgi:PIN domain nuclease of toxin-antitoxin system
VSLLLDTHSFLWFIAGDARLTQTAAEHIAQPDTRVFVSVVSAWEIVIKQGTGKLELESAISEWWTDSIARNHLEVLNISSEDVFAVEPLTLFHRDPFDRLLIAQAINHGLTLVSADSAFDAYPVQRVW